MSFHLAVVLLFEFLEALSMEPGQLIATRDVSAPRQLSAILVNQGARFYKHLQKSPQLPLALSSFIKYL